MDQQNSLILLDVVPTSFKPSLKKFVAIAFRRKRAVLLTFGAMLLIAISHAMLNLSYRSEMKILVKRVDPLVSAESLSNAQFVRDSVTEEELNSEIELLRSSDVLEKVVLDTGLDKRVHVHFWTKLSAAGAGDKEKTSTAKAVSRLAEALSVEPAKKSNVIVVSYRSGDPQLAHDVVAALSRRYLEKHVEVGRPVGGVQFFDQQVERYRDELERAQQKLSEFPRLAGAVVGKQERDISIQQLGDMKNSLRQTEANIVATKHRLADLRQQASRTPQRLTTQVRREENAQLMQQMKSTLLGLELKRTELLQRYEPSYRPLQELELQIRQAKNAIAAAERSPMRDETTDRNPTYGWVADELAKNENELAALTARAEVTRSSIAQLHDDAQRLSDTTIAQDNLMREAKTLEENYQMYLKKREEARISEALDRNKILNVSLAEPATLPILPVQSPLIALAIGLVAATFLSMAAAFLLEYADNSFRTPDEVRGVLGVPTVAALPASETGGPDRVGALAAR